nr:hypothetical protein GCM10017547_08950 [Pseudarthrobacter oxydans]
MAGKFEAFVDSDSSFRFRLLAPDGAVMAVSGPYQDKAALAAGIAVVRECAGTGLVTDLCSTPGPQPARHPPASLLRRRNRPRLHHGPSATTSASPPEGTPLFSPRARGGRAPGPAGPPRSADPKKFSKFFRWRVTLYVPAAITPM